MNSGSNRVCAHCRRARGTNPACPKCSVRRASETARMSSRRSDDRARGLCAAGCGDPPSADFDTCTVCRGKGRQRRRMHRLRALSA